MASIHVLKPNIANQIAAGEVVERPASIVKELVENSIDAGATAVSVEIERGGMQSIRITDNGCGIHKEDCRTAFLRHATSKISTVDDLNSLITLGFRGEALASIASVARVTMITRTPDANIGTKLVLDNGEVIQEEETACVYGTTFCVEALFASVPARLKFLKSPRTEAGYIGDLMARIILARPDISFRYVSDGKTVYETYGDGDLFNCLYCIYGKTISEKVVPVEYDNGYLKISGYLGLPEISRSNRTYQTLLLNGRYIRSASVASSVLSAFDTRLMIGKFPFFVLSIIMSAAEFDVNVHPTKLEVRFADEHRLCGAVHMACKQALSSSVLHVESALDTYFPKDTSPSNTDEHPSMPTSSRYSNYNEGYYHNSSDSGLFSTKKGREESYVPNNFPLAKSSTESNLVSSYHVPQFTLSKDPEPRSFEESLLTDQQEFHIIGCAFRTYWIIEKGENLYLIDQHAAHERALFDQLSSRTITISSQALLVPYEVTLTPSEAESLETFHSEIESLGFSFAENSGLHRTVTSVPVLNGIQLAEDYLHEVLETIIDYGTGSIRHLANERLMQAACKHAIKGGDPVSKEEIEELLTSYLRGESPLTCPHGRPVIVRISKTELEKMFRRIV